MLCFQQYEFQDLLKFMLAVLADCFRNRITKIWQTPGCWRGRQRKKGHGGEGMWFSKMLCRAFGDESLVDGTSTVKDYCDGVKADLEEDTSPLKEQINQIFEEQVKPLKDQIKELVEAKVDEVKDTIRDVCDNGDFSGDRKLNRLCQKLQETDN